jgi:hypothetical protein
MMGKYSKGILAAIGQVAALGTCIGTDAPEWLAALVGVAGTALVVLGPRNATSTEREPEF